MGKVIPFRKKTSLPERLKIRDGLITANDGDMDERMDRVRDSIERINNLMNELKSKKYNNQIKDD